MLCKEDANKNADLTIELYFWRKRVLGRMFLWLGYCYHRAYLSSLIISFITTKIGVDEDGNG